MNKNIEKLLQGSHSRPDRELSDDFTERITRHLAVGPPKNKREWWARYLQPRTLRLLPRPILATILIAMVLVVGGSAYAVVTIWPDTSATLHQATMLPSGNRIVAVDTDNCLGFQNLDGTAKPDGKDTVYYEVRKDSAYTNEQIVTMVQANCEENVSDNAMNAVVKERFGDTVKGGGGPSFMSGNGFAVKAIDSTSLTLGADPKWFSGPSMSKLTDVTYRRMAPGMVVYDRAKKIAFHDLRPGDSVKILVRDEHQLGSETDSKDHNHWDDPDLIVIEAIIKIPTPSTPPSTFYGLVGVDLVRVEPCKASPSGFCRVYEFIKDDFTKGIRTEPN